MILFVILDFLAPALSIVLAAKANGMAGRKYLRHGWEFADPGSEAAQMARAKWRIPSPAAI
jgi:hypothetical protein